MKEECGYDVPHSNIRQIQSFPGSVGISGERMTMFYAEVTDAMKSGMNCTKIGLPGKLILSKRKGLREVLFS